MHAPERIWLWCYAALGPGAWLCCAYLLLIGRERMNKLRSSKALLPNPPPLISILIPAKDEGARIGPCLRRVLEQDYCAIEVIAINDRSTDDTGTVMNAMARTHVHSVRGSAGNIPVDDSDSAANELSVPQSLRVIHIESLPPGWLGKCHALDEGAKHATGEWLLFVDSDVVLQPDALSKLAALAIAREYDALSILTTIETHRLIEKMMLPLLAATWTAVFKGDQTNEDSEPDLAIANGQVFLIRKSAYLAVGGHAAVKDRIVEDVELARLLKKQGFKVRLLAGRHLACTRMHETLSHMFSAWARIFAGTSRGRIWPMLRAIGFILVCGFSLVPAAGWAIASHNTMWLYAAVTHAALLLGINGFIWRWSGNHPLFALLLPISAPIEVAILAYSIRKAISGKIDWRGSTVDLRQASRAIKSPPP